MTSLTLCPVKRWTDKVQGRAVVETATRNSASWIKRRLARHKSAAPIAMAVVVVVVAAEVVAEVEATVVATERARESPRRLLKPRSSSADLLRSASVCKGWHGIFTSFIWDKVYAVCVCACWRLYMYYSLREFKIHAKANERTQSGDGGPQS
mmetsp:Transcript_12292/g.44825  ORF Transcript_12292/g.44825 Transcript_12292/m.44825 type:complete len:152 (+) Transcript_12292:1590-2045(+)